MTKRQIHLKGGVLIIGSLLWDNDERGEWRKEHLKRRSGFKVYLPIRYGRLSPSRNNTYTMVFSNEFYSKRYGLGVGWCLPLKHKISSFCDLKNEAQALCEAEGGGNALVNGWRTVGLLLNPKRKVNNSIIDEWKGWMSTQISSSAFLTQKLRSEKPAISSNGLFSIRWPEEVKSAGKLADFDFLLATVTLPSLEKGRYPRVYKIANTTNKDDEYFVKNRKHGICTFQDAGILKVLKSMRSKEN